jgi:hypothetical protein
VIVQGFPEQLSSSPATSSPNPHRLQDVSPALTDFSIPSSSLHMGSLLQSSSQTTPASGHPPASLPPLPSLSQPLFAPADPARSAPTFNMPSVNHPNSPYVPWDSPRRQEIMRPPTSSSRISGYTSYSRPYSRSGACAPEPVEIEQSNYVSFSMVGALRRLTQTMKRNVSRTLRRVGDISKTLSTHRKSQEQDRVIPPHYSISSSESSDLASPLPDFGLPERFSIVSSDTNHSNSLAVWLESHQRVDTASPRPGMTLDEYERRGSWLLSRNAQARCDDSNCSVHSSGTPSTDYGTVLQDATVLRLMRLDTSSRSSSLRRRRSESPVSLHLMRVRTNSLHGPSSRVPSSLCMDYHTGTIPEAPSPPSSPH